MMAPVTHLLLMINAILFVLEGVFGEGFVSTFSLWPLGPDFEWWQILTSAFLHGNLVHLATNMFGLWMFGRDVESLLGSRRFLRLYLLSAVTASLTQLIVTTAAGANIPTLGASGAVFGVLGAFALLYPRRMIILLIPPIPLPARVFVFLYALFELTSGVLGTQAGVAHFAHLGGLIGGVLIVWRWRRHFY